MRISDATSPARDVEVQFEGGILNVSYRPISYTFEEMEKISDDATELANSKDTPEQRKVRLNKILDTISNIVVSWDLENDDGIIINPQDRESLRQIPLNIFSEIIKAVNADQRPSGEA